MYRILLKGGLLAGEFLGQAGMFWLESPAVHPGWMLAGAVSILISVQCLAGDIFARITEGVEKLPPTLE